MPHQHGRLAILVFGVLGCQHIDDVEVDEDGPAMPVSTEEHQRINIDAVPPPADTAPGVGPVRVTSLADPKFPMPREYSVSREDAPPPEPPASEARKWYLGLGSADRKLVLEICNEAHHDPCFGMLPEKQAAPTTMQQLMARLTTSLGNERITWTVHNFCHERDPGVICDTPLVVAFDGEAIQFEASAQTFAFQPGVPVSTDWPTATTPWIALDRDGDGAITSGAELFGDATQIPGGKATNGFAALAALDANRDGVIDRRDPAFAKLVLWADHDRDRKSSALELTPLSSRVIAIPLANQLDPRCVHGNCEGERGAMTWRDPSGRVRSGAVVDVYLQRRSSVGSRLAPPASAASIRRS